MTSIGLNPMTAVHLNVPSVNVPVLPGRVVTVRTATNATNKRLKYTIETEAPAGSTITVSPKKLNIAPERITGVHDHDLARPSPRPDQQFGEIRLNSDHGRLPGPAHPRRVQVPAGQRGADEQL